MPGIDKVLHNILVQLAVTGPSNVENTYAEKLFNMRLIDYEIGSRWKINSKGLDYLAAENK